MITPSREDIVEYCERALEEAAEVPPEERAGHLRQAMITVVWLLNLKKEKE